LPKLSDTLFDRLPKWALCPLRPAALKQGGGKVIGTVSEELLALSADRANLTQQEVLHNLLCPDWEKADQMYDWRNHVKFVVREHWDRLSQEAKLVAFIQASIEASDEGGFFTP
jgi:hypothetical protein